MASPMAEPVRFDFRYETRADIGRAFWALADTDAFNGVARADMTFTEERQEDGSVATIGSVKKLGLTVRWRERPFSFRAPHWFKIRRDFENGPASSMTARAQLAKGPRGGTVIAYQLEVVPRTAIFRPVLAFDLKRSLEPNLRKALERVVEHLERSHEEDPHTSFALAPPALKPLEAARLAELADELLESTHRDRLLAFIRAAPEREQYTMSPIALSEAWSAPLEDVTALCVAGAKVGLLGVRVDLLCPACMVPKASFDEQGRLPDAHCDACGIKLDAAYAEGLAVHFFPSPKIRTLNVKVECVGSPAKTPNVVAQDTVAPGAEVDLATTLEAGTYQLRTMPAAGPPALVDVREGEVAKELRFSVQGSIQPQLARVRPQPSALVVRNASSAPVRVVLERLVPPRRVLSLGRMLVEYPALREICPATGFIASLSSFSGFAVAIRATSDEAALATAGRLPRARLTYASGPVVLAIYADGERAHEDLRTLDLAACLVGVSEGTVCESVIGGRRVPVGPAIDEAYAAMCGAGFGRIGDARPTTAAVGAERGGETG